MPRPLVTVGPSGIGKGTIIRKLRKYYPGKFGFSVSHTTRAPRAGETDGVEYHFVAEEVFLSMIEKGELIEWAKVHGRYYGTSYKAVDDVHSKGQICILDLNIDGAISLAKSNLDPFIILFKPVSFEALAERLRGRATESPEQVEIRLTTAHEELIRFEEHKELWNLSIVNDTIKETLMIIKKHLYCLYNDILLPSKDIYTLQGDLSPCSVEKGPRPIVFVGPSGIGKGTVIRKLFKYFPNLFGFSVSHTTRGPRAGETNGVEYNFVSEETFLSMISKNELIEHASVHGRYYGTSYAAVENVHKRGQICILDLNIDGAISLYNSTLKPFIILLKPVSFELLAARLRGRGTESEQQINTRLKTSQEELVRFEKNNEMFNLMIINDQIMDTINLISHSIYSLYSEFIDSTDHQPEC